MPSPRDAYDILVDQELKRPGVTLGRSLNNEVLMVDGRIYAFFKDGRLVVKIPARRAAELLATDAASAFRAGGRTMREWVMLELADPGGEQCWRDWMQTGRDYVRSLRAAGHA